MKITRNISEQLIVEHKPVVIAAMCTIGALMFAGGGLAMLIDGQMTGVIFLLGSVGWIGFLVIFTRRVQLIFDATENTLIVQRKSLIGAQQVIHQLDDVVKAEVESTRDDGSTLYRVSLLLKGESSGLHPITTAYSNMADHRGIAETINTWLETQNGQ